MDYDDFLRHICPMLDLNWRKYRRRAARRGVQARIRELGLPGYAAYLDVLIADSAEARALPDRMLVTVSRFFRERDRWRILSERVLPVLACEAQRAGPSGIGAGFPGKDAQALVKAWSVGACGGEEPYTLSMVWLSWEAGGRQDAAVDILATDIDPDSLERARTADYQGSSLREVPSAARDRWFRQIGPDSWHVTEAARRPVRFWRHHLLDDLPPPASDLILCRYLAFTYFIGDRRRRAVERLAAASRPGGALMVGAKEDPGGSLEGLFQPWPEAPGVYRRL
ncbi:MAG: hypothetical protein M5U22_08435 [Thermoleophilia bacterium]|nr:hypothetical protein [Thermoleophilia bacterium]